MEYNFLLNNHTARKCRFRRRNTEQLNSLQYARQDKLGKTLV
jgi:hypothetical protein